jgi:hypothetical protein
MAARRLPRWFCAFVDLAVSCTAFGDIHDVSAQATAVFAPFCAKHRPVLPCLNLLPAISIASSVRSGHRKHLPPIPQSSDQFDLTMADIEQLLLARQFEQHGNALAGDRLGQAFKAIQRRVLLGSH